MREVFDKRMTELESKIDASQQRLESRVVEIEKKLQIHNEIPDIPDVPVDEEKTIDLPTNLPVLTEVCNYSHIKILLHAYKHSELCSMHIRGKKITYTNAWIINMGIISRKCMQRSSRMRPVFCLMYITCDDITIISHDVI